MVETIIVASNLSECQVSFVIEYGKLQNIFERKNKDNAVIIVKNLLDQGMQYYFMKEFLQLKTRSL